MDRKRGREEEEAGADERGGEISLSIEETNKLRLSLGLKPLQQGSIQQEQDEAASRRHQEQRHKQEQAARVEQFKQLQAAKKRQRAQDDFLNVKTLGEADDDGDDDMATWVEKSRVADVARRAEEAYAKRQAAVEAARKAAAAAAEADAADGEEGGGAGAGGYSAADLAGLKVRHNVDDLEAGETLVLTLADRRLLDEKGSALDDEEGGDELVNALKFEDRQRQRAREAAGKAKPLWEEDGKRRGLLDKYDEADQDIVLQLGEGGAIAVPDAIKADVKRKLAEGNKLLGNGGAAADAPVSGDVAMLGGAHAGSGLASGDYQSAQDAVGSAAFKKRDKKKGAKKERKIRAKSAEPEEADTTALIEQLEAQAEVAGSGAAELGRRGGRMTAREAAEASLRLQEVERRARFEAAVEKSNWASQALRPADPKAKEAPVVIGDDDEAADRELQESLARARRLAHQKVVAKAEGRGGDAVGGGGSTVEEIAAAAARAREEEEARLREEIAAAAAGGGKTRVVTDTSEFVRNIQLPAAGPAPQVPLGAASVVAGTASHAPGAAAAPAQKDDYMGLDEDEGGVGAEEPPEAIADGGGWVPMDVDEGSASVAAGTGPVRPARQLRRTAADDGARAAAAAGQGAPGGGKQQQADDETQDSGVGEASVGRGLASALGLLKERGRLELESGLVWAGRTNDKSKNALQGLVGDVYAGGGHEERLARSIETALTTKDEFGRVMTPKERFRHLCYDFHGMRPSKNKEEKRLQKAAEEIARRKAATSEVEQMDELQGLKKVTEKVAQPFVVLQGKGAMDSLRSMLGNASTGMPPPKPKKPAKMAAPPPPGNLTPLLGDRKVEAMLGVKKPPPPPHGPPSTAAGRRPPPPGPPPRA